jgi:F-type H+-transporting ATPase subunit b
MRFDWWTLALQTINFGILVWLLQLFLYKPVFRMIDKRRADIEKQYAKASAAETKARDRLATVEAERGAIGAERDAALRAAAAEAEELALARHARAEEEAAALLEGARKTIAAERAQALDDARRIAVDLGTDVARRLLGETPVTVCADALLERIEKYLSALPNSEMKSLARQFENGALLTVVTASPLAPDDVDAWRGRFRHLLGEGIAITFQADPDLLAGAELHFPSAILRFSWRNAIERIRLGIGAR